VDYRTHAIVANAANLLATARVLRGWEGIKGWFVLVEFPDSRGRSIPTLQRWEKEKGMPVFRRGNNVYSHPSYLVAWLLTHKDRDDFYPKRAAARAAWKARQEVKREIQSLGQESEAHPSI